MLNWETEKRVIRNFYYTVPVNKVHNRLGYSELNKQILFYNEEFDPGSG